MALNAYQTTNHYLEQAFELLKLPDRYRAVLVTPSRELRVELVIELDDGSIGHYIGYRVQHDDSRGPYKGGLRYHPDVDLDEVRTTRAQTITVDSPGINAYADGEFVCPLPVEVSAVSGALKILRPEAVTL